MQSYVFLIDTSYIGFFTNYFRIIIIYNIRT